MTKIAIAKPVSRSQATVSCEEDLPGISIEQAPAKSVFRTAAWLEAWLETYGRQPGVEIIDVAGTGRCTDLFYQFPTRFLKVFPAKVLSLVGCQAPGFSSPRAEYNMPLFAVEQKVAFKDLVSELKRSNWSMMALSDVPDTTELDWFSVRQMSGVIVQEEMSHQVNITDFKQYISLLGKNTRSRFFNKFNRLTADYQVDFEQFDASSFEMFSDQLNAFHIKRWGVPCYSPLSVKMMAQFVVGLEGEGGKCILEVMKVNGMPESVLFDVVWQGRRYNLQCGFNENFSSQIKLGSLHLGKAIKEAIESEQVYDMLAGTGKKSDYKVSLANASQPLVTAQLSRGVAKIEQVVRNGKRKLLDSWV